MKSVTFISATEWRAKKRAEPLKITIQLANAWNWRRKQAKHTK